MSRLDEIPTAFDAPVDARPSAVVARIRAIRPSRRTVVRGLIIGAAAAALVPIDWFLTRRRAAAQETEGDDKSEYLTCEPESYREEANNWPATGPAVCYGGWRRGGYPCEDGYHREGTFTDGPDSFESTRVTTSCHGRNAWRWNGYRCSDAITTATYADGTEYRGISIAACALDGAAAAEPAPEQPAEPSESAEPSGSTEPSRSTGSDSTGSDSGGSDSGGSGSGGSGPDGTGTADEPASSPGTSSAGGSSGDPSRPRRMLPSLGTGMDSVPVLGPMLGVR